MIKISRKIEYSLMLLKHIENHSKNFSARDLCDQYRIPFDTGSKILQVLNKKGILSSTKGVNGGYALSGDLQQISYLNLLEIIEGKTSFVGCVDGKCALYDNCNVVSPITRLDSMVTNLFSKISIHDLLHEKIDGVQLTGIAQ